MNKKKVFIILLSTTTVSGYTQTLKSDISLLKNLKEVHKV